MAISPLATAVRKLSVLMETPGLDEAQILPQAQAIMHDLVQGDQWLPNEMAQPHPQNPVQYLLYADPQERYSLVSFVLGPGQSTPVHNHTVWGVIGILRGAKIEQPYTPAAQGPGLQKAGPEKRLIPGQVSYISSTTGDIHQVRNALNDEVTISIHLYGGNIGRIHRHSYDPDTGVTSPFVSGYANQWLPNLWADCV